VDRQPQRRLRAVRGAAASLTTILLAATAHTLAGAGAPSPLLIAIAALLTMPLGVALVGRRPSVVRTGTAVAGAQLAFHTLFAVFDDADAVSYMPPPGLAGHAAAHAMPTMTMLHTAASAHDMRPGSPMVLAHVFAAVVTVILLHHGERMLRALGRGILRLLPRLVAAPPRPPVRRQTSPVVVRVARRTAVMATALSRRGPPLPA